jgi:5-methylcytosine-specific restriction protein A
MASLAARKGCRNANELLQRVTRASAVTVEKRLQLGARTRFRPTLAGFDAPPMFPEVSRALDSGEIGVDAAAAIVRGLLPVVNHASISGLAAAETELVAAAIGTGADSPVAFSADEMRIQAHLWQLALDPDGADLAEERAMGNRELRLGRESRGLIPLHGALLPEIAAKLTTLLDSCLSPRTGPSFAAAGGDAPEDRAEFDRRTRSQQRHDVFAALIDGIARGDNVPTVGGSAPTVLVTVRSSDLDARHGAGYIDGLDTPISMRAVKQFICTGGAQTVLMSGSGRILRLWSAERCFTPTQRRAISARDGGCIVPGCSVPARWCEIHHVVPDRDDGPTETDNGVLLCWFHHRTIETAGWQVRMVRGSPQIKAPPWIDARAGWRWATKSRTAVADRMDDARREASRREFLKFEPGAREGRPRVPDAREDQRIAQQSG